MPRGNSDNGYHYRQTDRLDPASFRASDAESQRLVFEARMCLEDLRVQLTDVVVHLAHLKASIAVPSEFLKSSGIGSLQESL